MNNCAVWSVIGGVFDTFQTRAEALVGGGVGEQGKGEYRCVAVVCM